MKVGGGGKGRALCWSQRASYPATHVRQSLLMAAATPAAGLQWIQRIVADSSIISLLCLCICLNLSDKDADKDKWKFRSYKRKDIRRTCSCLESNQGPLDHHLPSASPTPLGTCSSAKGHLCLEPLCYIARATKVGGKKGKNLGPSGKPDGKALNNSAQVGYELVSGGCRCSALLWSRAIIFLNQCTYTYLIEPVS
jgi:hypothetical protein